MVGQVRHRTDAISVNLLFAMNDRDRPHLRAEKRKWTGDLVQLYLGDTAELVIIIEDILERPRQRRNRVRVRIERNSSLVPEAQWTKIVKSQDVIGVRMGVEHRIESGYAFADRLLAKIRRRIN